MMIPALRTLLLAVAIFSIPGQSAETVEWFGFTAYPSARGLCSQTVRGQGGEEIFWHSYAAKDPPSAVGDFYAKSNASAERKGDTLTLKRGEFVLSVHPAASGYPQCDRKPSAADRTVIVVSRISRPGKE